jgi:hypothetical protein
MAATSRNYTGQVLDLTGLLYYHARMYDPNLGRFVSADSIVPGAASGAGGGAATIGRAAGTQLKALTVDFHEPGFVSTVNGENRLRFWFQMDEEERQQAGSPWGPANPQALNRYSYTLNNPLRYTDPTGHEVRCFTGPGCANAVYNYSNVPIVVYGERRKEGCTANTQSCFEYIAVVVYPGESSIDYGIYDADFVRPTSGTTIDGHDNRSAYKVTDGMGVEIHGYVTNTRGVIGGITIRPFFTDGLYGIASLLLWLRNCEDRCPGWKPASRVPKPDRWIDIHRRGGSGPR